MEDKIIIDANFFVALFSPHDPKHTKAEALFLEINNKPGTLYTNNYLVAEVYTVLLIRTKRLEAVHAARNEIFQQSIYPLTIYHVTKGEDEAIYDLFSRQEKYKGEFLSFADCSLLTQARKQKMQAILTFDTTFKQFAEEFTIIGVE